MSPDTSSKPVEISLSPVFKRNMMQYPFPIALSCQKLQEEKELLPKLSAIFEIFDNVISYVNAIVLSSYYHGSYPLRQNSFYEMAGELELPDINRWFSLTSEAMTQEVKGPPVIEDLKVWYNKIEGRASINLQEIVNYKKKNRKIGHLTYLYEIRKMLLPALSVMGKEEKQLYFDQCWRSLEIILTELQFLKLYPLCYIEKNIDDGREIIAKRLMGTEPSLDQISLKEGQQVVLRQSFLYDEGNSSFYPLHPLVIFQECYYCLREKQSNSWELFVFQGKTASRLCYSGSKHKSALREPVETYVELREGVRRQITDRSGIDSVKDIWEASFQATEQNLNELKAAKILQSYYPRKLAEYVLEMFTSDSHSLFMLTGGKGTGKTVLLAEMARKWLAHGKTVLFFRVAGQKRIDIQDEIERALGEEWTKIRDLAEAKQQKWIIILDGIESVAMPRDFFANLAGFVKTHQNTKVIISLSDFYCRMWEKYISKKLFMPVDGPCPILESRLPYLRLGDFSQEEVKEACSTISADVEGSTPSFSSIPKKLRGLLRNPSITKIFLWCLRNQEVPRYLSIRDVMEGFVMNHINFSKKRREFVERFSAMLTNIKPLPVTMETIIENDDEYLLKETLGFNFPSGLAELVEQGILERRRYLHKDGKSYMIDFPMRLLQEYESYRAIAIEGKHRDDLLMNYLADIASGNFTLWGVVHFAMLRLVDKQYCERFVEIMKKAPTLSPAASQIMFDILVIKENTGSQSFGTGGYLDSMINDLFAISSQEVMNGLFSFALYMYKEEKYKQAAQLLERLAQCNFPLEGYDSPALQLVATWSYQKAKDYKRAAKLYKKSVKSLKKIENTDYELEFYSLLGRGYLELGDLEKAETFFRKCYEDRAQIRGTEKEADLYENFGKLAEQNKDYQKALKYYTKQQGVLQELGNEVKLADALENRAKIMARGEERQHAIELYREGSSIFQEIGYQKRWAICRQKLAGVLADTGETQEARSCLIECLDVLETLGEKEILARSYLSLGHICGRLKKQEECLEYFKMALEILTDLDNENGMAQCYEKFGIIYLEQGKYKEAQENFKKAMHIFEKNGVQQGLGDVYNHLGDLYRSKHNFSQASNSYRESFKIRQSLKDLRGMAEVRINLAEVLARNNSFSEAVEELNKGKQIYQKLKDLKGMAQTVSTQALIYHLQGENSKALESYQECAKMLHDIREYYILGGIYNRIGLIYKQRGNLYEALSHFEKSIQIQVQIGDMAGLAATYNNIGLIHDAKNEYQKALEYYTKDLEITEKLGDRKGCATSYDNIAMLHYNHGYYARALWFFEKAVSLYKELGDNSTVKKVRERIQQVKEKL